MTCKLKFRNRTPTKLMERKFREAVAWRDALLDLKFVDRDDEFWTEVEERNRFVLEAMEAFERERILDLRVAAMDAGDAATERMCSDAQRFGPDSVAWEMCLERLEELTADAA